MPKVDTTMKKMQIMIDIKPALSFPPEPLINPNASYQYHQRTHSLNK
jgi:hypothetical protein